MREKKIMMFRAQRRPTRLPLNLVPASMGSSREKSSIYLWILEADSAVFPVFPAWLVSLGFP